MSSTVGVGASGFMGVAVEATSGTYTAPTKFFPFESESVKYTQEPRLRRPIRAASGIVGIVAGPGRVEGDIQMEAFEEVVLYFLRAAATSMQKAGSTPNFTYTVTPAALAVPAKTLSITIVRNGEVFGYSGCTVSAFTFTTDEGALKFNVTILGRDEASEALPTATWPASQVPYGPGKYSIEIPTGSQVLDTDTFTFTVDNGAAAQMRLKDDSPGSAFVAFGESSAVLSVERDFTTRDDYDSYKAMTSQSVTIDASLTSDRGISILMPAAIKDDYTVGLSGQSDLVRASISYTGILDSAGKDYQITVKSGEDLVLT